ncbi:Oligopeptide transport ATP-binding protein OppF [bioreactor metagenome]|uniref:Oligopeptide transport ATP-binding protein OppF n=1 Tax=bioreactor metagenome TaxID=1076179 RepID=A0A645CZH8_9ZZZZ
MTQTNESARQVPVMSIKDLKKYFPVRGVKNRKLSLKAVDGVSLDIMPGETVGLVGESGCGKSTLGRTILGLQSATDGQIEFMGENIVGYNNKKLRPLRQKMQIIFQDPYASLDPRKTVFDLVRAPLDAFHIGTEEEKKQKTQQILEFVGLGEYQLYKFPHELSGGQRQRVVTARAMVVDPAFILCDEPVSALDVSVRSQVLNLMKEAQEKTGVAYLFISHDMSVVRYLCDRVAVMYLGKLVEFGSKKELFENPLHPYTKALLSAIPVPDVDKKRERIFLPGDVPSPLHPPKGCRFHNRCPYAQESCGTIEPQWQDMGEGHFVACPYALQIKSSALQSNKTLFEA